MPDLFEDRTSGLDSPFTDFVSVTPSDTVDLPTRPRGLWIGGGGTVVVQGASGVAVPFYNVVSGTLLPLRARRVLATGTTATNIVAGW
ncbi:spike base protein, RCAP_Rcc01079 family [Roseomonas sp. USHLN139]|uniref:spike base protein, RCAP_Rcc01079 family n=1 Tax=Roseomonas sp. USHLN139 TaxID=3081298 RepID=UPI003B016EA6